MKIVCDACSAKYSIADEKVRGKVFKIRCKKCSNIIVVRGAVNEQGDAAAPQYDPKQTKVLDNGQERADSAAEVSESAIWHLVIDQEQVGPMTVEEVRDRIQRGEVDSEGFVWREGYGDWERLADVEEFSSLVGSAPANGGVGVLFAGSTGAEYDEARAAQNDPADLFATRGAGDDAGVAADLFAGTGLGATTEASSDTDGLFSGDGGLGVGGDAPEKPVVAALTAQRNENSVLFSLNNLAALASDAPRPAPAPAKSSPSSSSSMATVAASKAPQSEGSGLIDIRSMAQVYLGDTKAPSKPVGSADDLPVFSQASFESASPVLLPTVQPAVNNRLLIALIGLIGVLVVAAVVLVVIVLKGGGDAPKVAAADPATTAAPAPAAAPSAPAGEATAPAAPAAGDSSGGEATAAAAAPAADGDDSDKSEPPADDSADAAKTASRDKDRDQKDRKDRKDRDRDRDRGKDKDKDKGRDKRADRRSGDDSSGQTRSAAPAPDPTATSGCDEVTCLVEPDKPCCKKYSRRSSGSSSRSSGSADPSLPDQPSRGDVASGIGNVKGNVSACGSRSPGGGKVTVKIKISPAGSVSSASASGGSASLNGCVESAVRRARFPKSQYGVSVNYPFIF